MENLERKRKRRKIKAGRRTRRLTEEENEQRKKWRFKESGDGKKDFRVKESRKMRSEGAAPVSFWVHIRLSRATCVHLVAL